MSDAFDIDADITVARTLPARVHPIASNAIAMGSGALLLAVTALECCPPAVLQRRP